MKGKRQKFTTIMAAVVVGGMLSWAGAAGVEAQVTTGGPKPGKALWTDYWGMSKEIQGTVDTIIFTQSKNTAAGDPYHNYPHYVPEGSRIVSYNMSTKQLKVLTEDFSTAFDPCVYWDGKKFTFAGINKKGGGCQIWEMNVDGTGARQMTDLPGTARSPIYYAAGSIEEGKGRIIWRDRYFEGDWKVRGEVDKTGYIILAYTPPGVMDEYHQPYAYNLWRLDTQGGKVTERITGHELEGINFPNLNTAMDQITYNISSNYDPALTPDGNILFSSVQALGARANGLGRSSFVVDNWDGAYPRAIYGNCEGEGGDYGRQQGKCTPDGRLVFIEAPYLNCGIGNFASVSWNTTSQKSYRKLNKDALTYRSPFALPDGRIVVSAAERGNYGIYWFDEGKGTVGSLVYDDPSLNDHQPQPVYPRYKPRWINTFTAGKNFGVTTVTYQPFDQVKVEGYPHSWATWICFDTTLTNMPLGPYPHQRTKEMKHGDIKAVRIIEGLQCIEPDSRRFAVGAGKHLLGGDRTSTNTGTMSQQRRLIGYQYVEDDGSIVTSQPADVSFYIQIVDDKGMSVQTSQAWAYIRPYHGRICTGCHYGDYRTRAYKNIHTKALYNWWFSDLSHYDSPFAYANLKLDKKGNYAGVKHGEDVVVPSDVYYGGPSGTTSAVVEGLTDAKRRTVDFRRDLQPIIDTKCASCHSASQAPDLTGGVAPVSEGGIAAFSRSYNSLLAPQAEKDPNLGGKYVNPGSAINSLITWRLYEEELSAFKPKAQPFPTEGRVNHAKFLTPEERFLFVEWIDIGAQWDNIPGPDDLPGYRG